MNGETVNRDMASSFMTLLEEDRLVKINDANLVLVDGDESFLNDAVYSDKTGAYREDNVRDHKGSHPKTDWLSVC